MPLVTRQRLVRDLCELGVRQGDTLLLHVSLREIGWVEGGAPAVISALSEAVGAAGNLVVPTGTEENSLTSRAHQARTATMTPDEARKYRRGMLPFDPRTTPSNMGAVGESLRTAAGAVRSTHPQSSFAAVGRDAALLMADHRFNCHLGEYSPLAKLYEGHARVLMIGVDYRACTAFHLAEYRYTQFPPRNVYSCAAIMNERSVWISYTDVVLDDQDFDKIGEILDHEQSVKKGYVGNAKSRLMPLVQAVDHAENWMKQHRV